MLNLVQSILIVLLCNQAFSHDDSICQFKNYCPKDTVCKPLGCGNYNCVPVEPSGAEPCESNPCNDETCMSDDVEGYSCECLDKRYSGPNCRNVRPFVEVLANAYVEANISQYVENNFEYTYSGNDVSSNRERHSIIFGRDPYMTHHLAAVSDTTYLHEDCQLLKKISHHPLYALHYVTKNSTEPIVLKTISEATMMNEMRLSGSSYSDVHGYTIMYTGQQSQDNDGPYYARIFFVIRKVELDQLWADPDTPFLGEIEVTKLEAHTTLSASISNQQVGDVFGFTLLASYKESGSKPIDAGDAMQALLNKHVETVTTLSPIDVYSSESTVNKFADKISSEGGALSSVISGIYDYNQDEQIVALTSELSGDVISSGSYIVVGGVNGLLHYGQTYSQENHEFTSFFDDVLMGLMWISNEEQKQQNFTYNVQSFLPQFGSGKYAEGQGKMLRSRHRIQFKFSQAYDGDNGEHSVCEVHFIMHSVKNWGSSDISNEDYSVENKAESTFGFANEVFITGSPRKALAGFFTMAKTSSSRFTRPEVIAALEAKLRPVWTETNFGRCVNKK